MGLVGLVLGAPVAPVRGLVKLAELLRDQAERELHDPSAVRHELEAVEEARASGRISAADEARSTEQIVDRMVAPTDADTGQERDADQR